MKSTYSIQEVNILTEQQILQEPLILVEKSQLLSRKRLTLEYFLEILISKILSGQKEESLRAKTSIFWQGGIYLKLG